MSTVNLCLVLHCHQPVGNFDHVVADAFTRCYQPMLEVLAEHPAIRFGLHWSGILYDWAEQREPRTLELLHTLVDRGQVELLGGGYYEPLLPLLPPEDAVGQLRAMQEYVRARFGREPAGFWLTERVWEPQLPRWCAPVGLRYTLADETHFRTAGLPPDRLFGYYLTEDDGNPLAVFPVDKQLRYAIPFHEPAETVARLRAVAEQHPGTAVTYGDDGEKFGLWPGTYDWVYTRGYLHRFCEALEAEQGWLHCGLPERYRATHPPTGRVYLPTASYDEMETWVLGAEDQLTYDRLMHADLPSEERRFLRGGFFRNFLCKYPEANLMHKRMLQVSRRVAAAPGAPSDAMRRELWQGQCSCPYWHGLFGGLYLNGIRQANHHHLIRAGALADAAVHGEDPWVQVETGDFDCDGAEEISMRGGNLECWIHPRDGGTVSILDDRRSGRMLSDVLTRRREPYHAEVASARSAADAQETPASIHGRVTAKEAGLGALLQYDALTRACFRDRVLAASDTLADARAAGLHDAGDWSSMAYGAISTSDGTVAEVRLGTTRRCAGATEALRVEKRLRYDDATATLTVHYAVSNAPSETRMRFATELNLTLLATNGPARRLSLLQGDRPVPADLGAADETGEVAGFDLTDVAAGTTLHVACDPAALLWRYPVETVSNSETGFERTYQGTAFVFAWDWALAAGPAPTLTLTLRRHA